MRGINILTELGSYHQGEVLGFYHAGGVEGGSIMQVYDVWTLTPVELALK